MIPSLNAPTVPDVLATSHGRQRDAARRQWAGAVWWAWEPLPAQIAARLPRSIGCGSRCSCTSGMSKAARSRGVSPTISHRRPPEQAEEMR